MFKLKYMRKYIDIFSKNNQERVLNVILAILLVCVVNISIEAQKRSRAYENDIKKY